MSEADELVEVVARALHFDHVDQHGYPNGLMTWDEMPDHIERRVSLDARDHWRSLARAAITAARAAVLEEAAKVADTYAADAWGHTEEEHAALSIAKAIRALRGE